MFSSFALEVILATAFGRRVDIQKGESDEFTKAMGALTGDAAEDQFAKFTMLESNVQFISVVGMVIILSHNF